FFENSLYKALKFLYPEKEWKAWEFYGEDGRNIWNNIENARLYANWIESKLNIKDRDDWYKVKLKDLDEFPLAKAAIVTTFSRSLYKFLEFIYPEIEWKPWRFAPMPENTWEDPKIRRKFLDWAFETLNLKSMEDWYFINK